MQSQRGALGMLDLAIHVYNMAPNELSFSLWSQVRLTIQIPYQGNFRGENVWATLTVVPAALHQIRAGEREREKKQLEKTPEGLESWCSRHPPIHTLLLIDCGSSHRRCVCFFFCFLTEITTKLICNSIRRQSDGKLIERAVLSYLYEGLDMSHSNLVEAIAIAMKFTNAMMPLWLAVAILAIYSSPSESKV